MGEHALIKTPGRGLGHWLFIYHHFFCFNQRMNSQKFKWKKLKYQVKIIKRLSQSQQQPSHLPSSQIETSGIQVWFR